MLGPLDPLEALRAGDDFFDPQEIRLVVRLDPHLCAGRENLMKRLHELVLKKPPPVVVSLRPRVGKADVDDLRAADGQQPFRHVIALKTDDAAVFQMVAGNRAGDLFHAPEHALRAEKIPLRKTCGHREKKRSIAAAEINFQRRGS